MNPKRNKRKSREDPAFPAAQVGPERVEGTGVMIDVTSRRNAQLALKETEERFRTIFENSPAGMIIGDTSGRIIRANQSFCDLLGFSEEELQAQSAMEITHPEDRAATWAYYEGVQQGRDVAYAQEKRYVRKDGQVVWVLISAVPMFP